MKPTPMTDTQIPNETERQQLAIRSVRGVELGLGTADPSAVTAARIEAQYPTHLVLVQAEAITERLAGVGLTAYRAMLAHTGSTRRTR